MLPWGEKGGSGEPGRKKKVGKNGSNLSEREKKKGGKGRKIDI